MKKLVFLLMVVLIWPQAVGATSVTLEDMATVNEQPQYYARTFDNLVFDFKLSVSTRDELRTLVIKNSGTADEKEIAGLTLYRDDGDGVFEGFGYDTKVSEPQYYWNKIWYFDDLSESVGPSGSRWFVTATLKNSGENNRTFNFTIDSAMDDGDGEYQLGENGLFFKSGLVGPENYLTGNIYARYRSQSADIFSPKIVVENLAHGQVITEAEFAIEGLARDNGGSSVEKIEVCIDGDCEEVEEDETDFAEWTYYWREIDYGEHRVYFRGTDSVGNFSDSAEMTISAQNAVPKETENGTVVLENVEKWIKTAGSSTVYYLTQGKRYAYPTLAVWRGYFGDDFSFVKTVSTEEMAEYALAGNVLFKNGSLIKIPSVPKVYKVENGKLRWVTSEAVAVRLFGAEWAKAVNDLPEGFFPDYEVGEDLQ